MLNLQTTAEPTVIQAAVTAYLQHWRHALPANIDPSAVTQPLFALCEHEQERLDNQQPPCPVPLLWVALAEMVGLVVDLDTGRLVDGPRPVAQPSPLQ